MAIEVHFRTDDVQRAIDFYTNTLGFNLDFKQPDAGIPNFCILSFEGSTVMFGLFSKTPPATPDRNDAKLRALLSEREGSPGTVAIYIQAEDVHAHYEQVRGKGRTCSRISGSLRGVRRSIRFSIRMGMF